MFQRGEEKGEEGGEEGRREEKLIFKGSHLSLSLHLFSSLGRVSWRSATPTVAGRFSSSSSSFGGAKQLFLSVHARRKESGRKGKERMKQRGERREKRDFSFDSFESFQFLIRFFYCRVNAQVQKLCNIDPRRDPCCCCGGDGGGGGSPPLLLWLSTLLLCVCVCVCVRMCGGGGREREKEKGGVCSPPPPPSLGDATRARAKHLTDSLMFLLARSRTDTHTHTKWREERLDARGWDAAKKIKKTTTPTTTTISVCVCVWRCGGGVRVAIHSGCAAHHSLESLGSSAAR